MSTTPKPRGESKLKTLPEDRQAEIIAHMKEHKLAETRAWLKDDGLSVSASSLSDFWHWWHLQQQLRRNETTVEEMLADYRQKNPQASESDIFAMGQSFFSALALAQQDAEVWAKTQQLGLKRNEQRLNWEKFIVDSDVYFERLLKKAAELNTTSLSNADKIAAMRSEAFKAVDELQASGKVRIPKA